MRLCSNSTWLWVRKVEKRSPMKRQSSPIKTEKQHTIKVGNLATSLVWRNSKNTGMKNPIPKPENKRQKNP